MRIRSLPTALLFLFAVAGLWPDPCSAQLPIEPGQLPARTSFYLLWRGTPAGEVRNRNALYSLWDDPDFSAARTSLVEMLMSKAEARLGMPVRDALGVITGEVASLQTSPALDDSQKLYLLGIRNKPVALKLARSIMGDQITSERTEGSTTFFKISLRGGRSSAGLAQWNFYYLAMTPAVLLGASKTKPCAGILTGKPQILIPRCRNLCRPGAANIQKNSMDMPTSIFRSWTGPH